MKFNAQEQMGNEEYMTLDEYVSTLSAEEKKYHNYYTPSMKVKPWQMIVTQAKFQPDFLNATCLNHELNCVGYITDYVEVPNGFKLRCILVDDEMNTYSTISAGVAKVVKTWIASGIIPSVEEPLRVRYEQERKGMNAYYTLKMVWRDC